MMTRNRCSDLVPLPHSPWRPLLSLRLAAAVTLLGGCSGSVGSGGGGGILPIEADGQGDPSSVGVAADSVATSPGSAVGEVQSDGSTTPTATVGGADTTTGATATPATMTTATADATDGVAGETSNCADTGIADPGAPFSRRLNRTEFNNTVSDLLGDTTAPATEFPAEELAQNFDNNPAAQSVSPLLAEEYARAARQLAESADLASLLPCDANAGEACARQFIESFGQRAFRRPIVESDVTRFLIPFTAGAATSFDTGLRLTLEAMLQSADFLYRIELGGAEVAPGVVKVSSWEMAARLSYFLWNSMPDEALFQAAAADQLQTPEQVSAQATRMLENSRSRTVITDFHDQWLSLRSLDGLEKDQDLFPEFNQAVAADMRTEVHSLIEDVLFNGSGDMSQLFSASHTFVNGNLANFYGMGGVNGDGFQRVDLPPAQRLGVLSLGGIMAMWAKPNQTNPVTRGKFLRVQVFCDPPPDPPAGAMIELPELSDDLTTRERFTQHRSDPACAACHQLLDPLGLGFENFDAVGRWRDTENGIVVDASGEVVGTDVPGVFNGPAELGAKLSQSQDVKSCLVTNWFRYANGRSEASTDACALSELSTADNINQLLVAMTQTDAFLYRRSIN